MLSPRESLGQNLLETMEAIQSAEKGRFEEVEVLAKKGRSRRITRGEALQTAFYTHEEGWAVRASHSRGSFFLTQTGTPDPATTWPEADGLPLRLPSPASAPGWKPSPGFDAPLVGEREAQALLEGIQRALQEEVKGARLAHATLEDGASETQLVNSRGISAVYRSRLAALHLEAVGPGGEAKAEMYLAEREARRFQPLALARRLGDRLLVGAQGKPRRHDRGDCLLAPPVMVALLEAMMPLFLGPQSTHRVAELRGNRPRLASDLFTLLDNGRLAGGALEAPVDGEGLPTQEVLLVDRGKFRQPLLAWWQAAAGQGRGTGCCRRPSWRDVPIPGPTHLYLRPSREVSVGDLLSSLPRGYFLLDATGAARFDWASNRFAIPVCGFEVRQGRPASPVSNTHLCGSISGLLQGVQGVGRDLRFLPRRGMIGSPSALVSGLELRSP